MIRPITCLCALAACGAGLYLYQSKHQVQLLDRQIERTAHAIDATREQTKVLRAEWTLANDPDRLQQLAGQLLTLKPIVPSQFTSMAELDNRLPAVRAPDPLPPPPQPDAPAAASAPLVAVAEPAKPIELPQLPAAPPPAAASKQVASVTPPPAERKPVAAMAPAEPRPSADQRSIVARPVVRPVVTADLVRPRPLAPPVAQPVVQSAPVAPPPQFTGSLLGMARHSLVPPPALPSIVGTSNGN
jgi:hypothetical protein